MSLFLVCGRCSYARMIKLIQSRKYFEGLNENEPDEESQKKIDDMNKITLDEAITKQIIAAGHISMGQDISEVDLISINRFANKYIDCSSIDT